MERETTESEEEADQRRQSQGVTSADIASVAGDLAFNVDNGVTPGDLASGGIEAFKSVSRAITNAERQAAGALIDGIRGLADAGGDALNLAGNTADRVLDAARSAGGALPGGSGLLDAAGEAAGVAVRAGTRAANTITFTAGAMDAAQLASLPVALAETPADAIGVIARHAPAMESVVTAGLQAGGATIELAAKGTDLTAHAAGLVIGAAQHIDAGAVLHATADVASVAGEVGVHIVEAVVDGISSLS